MSYRGRPSKGCEGCRARKVKCDQTTPRCNRCARLGQECRYRDRTDILFRDQTDIAAQRAEDSWRRRSRSFRSASGESSTNRRLAPADPPIHSHSHQQARPTSSGHGPPIVTVHDSEHMHLQNERDIPPGGHEKLPIHTPPRQDLRQLAYTRLIYDFVVIEDPNTPFEEPSDALFGFVPLLYEQARPDSCLAIITNAVAYINFANRCSAPEVVTLAEHSFGMGIKMLSQLIASQETAVSDEALCSVHLMGAFETLTNFQRQGTFAAHQHGANALLQLRTIDEYYSKPTSARLYEVAYAQMLLNSLQVAKIPPISVQDAPSVREYLPSFFNRSDTFVIKLIWKEAQLHAMWHEAKRSSPAPTKRVDLQEILQLALDLDLEYQAWESDLPSSWKYGVEPNTPEAQSKYSSQWQRLVLTSKGAPTEVHTYTTLKRCSIWGYYRTSRMFLLRDLLEMLNWMSRLPETELNTSLIRTWKSLAYSSFGPSEGIDERTIVALDDAALHSHRSAITRHLFQVFDETCSSVLGAFTGPLYQKSPNDIMGMRGYIILWPLSTMDAILSSGLVLDSFQSAQTSASSTGTGGILISPFYHDISMATAAHCLSQTPPTSHSPILSDYTQAQASTPQTFGTTGYSQHPFESMPRHPYDQLVAEIITPELETIDIAAKREWLNSILYYIGSELGIKKALAVPVMEGYMPTVKARVDEIFMS